MVGVPVIINHKDLNKKNADEERVGVVNSVWYDNKDGWYWCDGIIWDETAQNLITDKNWSVSCSYDVITADNKGGSENNIKYDIEFLDGVFTHLALVSNPRYERANIVFNSKTEVLNDRWVTIKPNGEEHKGRHLLIKDGENVYDAMRRQWGVDVKGQQHLFDRNKYKTDTNYKEELNKKLQEHLKTVQKRYDNLEYLGVANPDELVDGDYEDISFEEWEDKQKDKEEKKETYYEDDMEESYTDSYADSIQKDFDEFMKSKKEEENRKTQANYGKKVSLKDGSKKGEIIGSVPRGKNPDKAEEMYLYEIKWDNGEVERIHSNKVNITSEEPPKSDLDTKREAYEATLKKMNEASKRKWNPKDNAEWYAAVKEESEAKKALTDLRRDYAESIMSNFEEVEDNPYDDKIAEKQIRYQELSQKAKTNSDSLAKQSHDMISAIPMGQPILVGHHSEMRDRRYRQRAWDKMDKAYELSKKADYYADKAQTVGSGGISADDKNAIKKLSDKYNSIKQNHQRMLDANKIIKSKSTDEEKVKKLIESGWSEENAIKLTTPSRWSGSVGFQSYELTSNTAEMRRIIDRVIDIHSRSLKAADMDAKTDYSDYGFEVERNTDINRLQLKFPGKPDASVRDVLKSNGFRWSPREGAWQRQLTGNAEYSLKRVMEKLKADNSKEQDMALLQELKKLITKVENDKGDDMDDKEKIENEKVDKRDIIRQIMAIAGKHEDNEDVKTIAKLAEKLGYDESEAGSADNKKAKNEKEDEAENCKVKNEDVEDKDKVADLKEDEKKDVENKCRNSVENQKGGFIDKMNEIYNSTKSCEQSAEYVSRDDKIKAANDYFAK